MHDAGNIVRFDFERFPGFIKEQRDNIDYWKEQQKKTIAKYGYDDHQATKKMLEELNIDKETIKVVLEKSFGNSVQTARGDNWYAKILLYCNLKVMPHGDCNLRRKNQ